MAPRICSKIDALDGRLPRLPDGADACRRTARMADDAAAAEIHQVDCPAGAPVGFRGLTAPLSRTDHGQGTVAGREERGADCIEGLDERVVRLSVLRTDAVDLELIDPEQPPELLVDAETPCRAPDGG